MPRRCRQDWPGALVHVCNRAVGRRTAFDRRIEIRYFLSLLARTVRDGLLEVISYSFPVNHFHLLLRSRTGELSRAMQFVESLYVRRFNQVRDRDGPLFRARFQSTVVDSDRYLYTLIRYIDQNAVRAGLVNDPAEYEFSSAYHYCRGVVPPWLSAEFFSELLPHAFPPGRFNARGYRAVFGCALSPLEASLVERRLVLRQDSVDPLDDLVGAATPVMRTWLERRAAVADGTRPGVVLAAVESLLDTVSEFRAREGDVRVSPGRKAISVWPVLAAGLLRDLSHVTHREAAIVLACSPSKIRRDLDRHRRLMCEDPDYADLAAGVAGEALKRQFPALPSFDRIGRF